MPVETRDWGPLSPMERFFVYQRIVCAYDLVLTLQQASTDVVQLPEGTSETTVLAWLLLYYWDDDRAVLWLKVAALYLHHLAPGLYEYHQLTEPPQPPPQFA
jgi:hypothetical protein